MSDNNMMYRMFRQMMQGYRLGKEGENLFAHAVHCWMDLNPDNPFQEESAAYDHFFRMKNYYNVWKMRSADQRISERRMVNEARELCATKPKNPYKFDKKAADEEKVVLRESAKKEQEEAINIQKEAEREKAEREAEIREILEEIRQDDLKYQEELLGNKAIVEEAKAEVIKKEAEKNRETENLKENEMTQESEEPEEDKESKKVYVFNAKEEAKEGKKGWLSRLLKR